MNSGAVSLADIRADGRLDAEFHLSPGTASRHRLRAAEQQGMNLRFLGGKAGIGSVWQPRRFRRVYAQTRETSIPYLRPYDLFDYQPVAADYLSATTGNNIDELRLREGQLVIPASGRNLGPCVVVDKYLARFALSHDAIRVDVQDERLRYFVAAYLNTPTAQTIIRRNITGSVIDHLGVADVEQMIIPWLSERTMQHVAAISRAAVQLRERARQSVAGLVEEFSQIFPAPDSVPRKAGWTTRARRLSDRLDAAAHVPIAKAARTNLRSAGGLELKELAQVIKPASRYKAFHVAPEHGVPFLTGSQLLQDRIIAPKYMARRVFQEPERYALKARQVVFAADGRANEGLGRPAVVTSDRSGWLASEHVMRLQSYNPATSGWLYLALALPVVQFQMQALPRGSVVDTLYVHDVERIVIPPVHFGAAEQVVDAWDCFAIARSLEDRCIALIETSVESGKGQDNSILLTEQEAVAFLRVSGTQSPVDVLTRLTPVGPAGFEQLFEMDEVIEIGRPGSLSGRTTSTVPRHRMSAVFVTVQSVDLRNRELRTTASTALDEPGIELVLPLDVAKRSGVTPRANATYLWRFSTLEGSVPDVATSSFRELPANMLTSDQVQEAYVWADRFLESHVRAPGEAPA